MMYDGCSPFDVEQQFPSSIVNNPSPSSSTWLHTPPSQMPWGIPLSDQPSVMRFTGDSCRTARQRVSDMQKIKLLKRKRKYFEYFEHEMDMLNCPPPYKQLITDEKMAANLSGLHISNDYTPHQFGSSVEVDSNNMAAGETRSEVQDSLPSLVLCEELRRLTSEPVIPSCLISKIERPTNALVLWQPPGGSIYDKLRMVVESSSSKPEMQTNSMSNSSMEASEEEAEPQPSTSGLNQFACPTIPTQNIWPEFVDNNNSSNIVDQNLLPTIGPLTSGTPQVTFSDDAMMDL